MKQFIFQEGQEYFLVDIYDSGAVTLKVKRDGWSDTWSLPLDDAGRISGPSEVRLGINEGIAR